MGFSARKTEHTGAKHGRRAYWGTKYEAKRDSRKIRRRKLETGTEKGPGLTPERAFRADDSPSDPLFLRRICKELKKPLKHLDAFAVSRDPLRLNIDPEPFEGDSGSAYSRQTNGVDTPQ